MLNKESETISDFIYGKLDEENRKKISDKIKSMNINIMKTENTHHFNSEKAWNKLSERIISDNRKLLKIRKIRIMQIAASLIILIGISALTFILFNTFKDNRFAEIKSGNKIQDIILPDGSQITMNKNSIVKYPKEFSGKTRTIEFKGEAFFKVEKNSEKPFIVKSGETEITVLGTSFNVENNNNSFIRVYVETGKVSLKDKNDKSVTLIPGDEGKIENNRLSKRTANNINYLAWRTKSFIYSDEYLKNVIQDFNKVYSSNIVFENEIIGNLKVNTELHQKSLTSALNIICTLLDLEYKTGDNQIIIYQTFKKR